MKVFKKTLFILFILFLLLLGAGIALFYSNKENIKKALISETNDYLNTKINVEEIHLGLFRHFPVLTAGFNRVVIFSPENFRLNPSVKLNYDTLLIANEIYFKINPIKLIRKEVFLSSLTINDARINVFINKKGKNNLQIFRKHKNPDTTGFTFDINRVEVHQLQFMVNDLSSGIKVEGVLKEENANLSDNFTSIKSRTSFQIHRLFQYNKLILTDHEVTALLDLIRKEKEIDIISGDINFSGLAASVSGTIEFAEEAMVKLDFKSDGNRLKDLVGLLPKEKAQRLRGLKLDGVFNFAGNMDGTWGKGKFPQIKLDFELKKGAIRNKKSGFSMKGGLKGSLNNGKLNNGISTSLVISSFSFLSGGETLKGSYHLRNLKKPEIKFSASGSVNLAEIKKILPEKLAADLSGLAKVDIQSSGYLADIKNISFSDMGRQHVSGSVKLVNVRYQYPANKIVFSDVTGDLKLGKAIVFDRLSLKLNNNLLVFTGKLGNLWTYLDKRKAVLTINGSINSPEFDLAKLIPVKKRQSAKTNDSLEIHFPKSLAANIHLKADKLIYRKFSCQHFSGLLTYQHEKMEVGNVSFSAMDGEIVGNALAYGISKAEIMTQANVDFKNIDIKKLFYQMGNFGQSFIVEGNLEGTASGIVQFSSVWKPNLRIDKKSILVNGHYVINDGRLVHFKPIESLSKFISLSELKDIQFSTMENDVYIKDEKISIPVMNIHSSAFNISATGIHSFDNHFDYHFKVLLSEVLASKAKRNKKKNQEFGIIEDDGEMGITIPLRISGTPDDFKVSYKPKGMKRGLKESVSEERKKLKEIFKKEFDKNGQKEPLKSNNFQKKKFIIEWDEESGEKTDTLKKDKSTR